VLSRFPANLVVMGDTVCTPNPVFAQAQTLAALEVRPNRKNQGAGTQGVGASLPCYVRSGTFQPSRSYSARHRSTMERHAESSPLRICALSSSTRVFSWLIA